MNWKEYENITMLIYETLGRNSGVKIEGYGSSCRVKGKSNVSHQIDVLTSHSNGIHNYKTAIECKYWKEKVNKDVVMKVAEIIEDTKIDKGVIVSKMGFSQDGINFAKYKNIGLVDLREIKDEAFLKLGEVIIKSNAELRRPRLLEILFDFVNPNFKMDKMISNQLILKMIDGVEIPLDNYLSPFKEKLFEEEPEIVIEKYYKMTEAKLFNLRTKEEIQINGFTLKGKLQIINEQTTRQFNIVDEVWMRMKSFFENESFSISKSGLIKRDK